MKSKSKIFIPIIFIISIILYISWMDYQSQSDQSDQSDQPDQPPPGMILIPTGKFNMGYDSGDPDERPSHKIFLDSYYIDKYELTNAQYYEFWQADGGEKSLHTPISFGEENGIGDWPKVAKTKPTYPVVGVSWFEAQAYAKWAKKRLPTESEWEKAARGTDNNDNKMWPWGDDFYLKIGPVTNHANVWNGNDGYDNSLAPVGSYETGASPYGVVDPAGNVWEWVADWYSPSYYYHSPQKNPSGPKTGSWRVVRGGSWANDAYSALTVNRFSAYPDMGASFIGIRLVKDVTKAESGVK